VHIVLFETYIYFYIRVCLGHVACSMALEAVTCSHSHLLHSSLYELCGIDDCCIIDKQVELQLHQLL
jgi:hypothetical protein